MFAGVGYLDAAEAGGRKLRMSASVLLSGSLSEPLAFEVGLSLDPDLGRG